MLSDRHKLTGVHGALDIRERQRWQSCWDCHDIKLVMQPQAFPELLCRFVVLWQAC